MNDARIGLLPMQLANLNDFDGSPSNLLVIVLIMSPGDTRSFIQEIFDELQADNVGLVTTVSEILSEEFGNDKENENTPVKKSPPPKEVFVSPGLVRDVSKLTIASHSSTVHQKGVSPPTNAKGCRQGRSVFSHERSQQGRNWLFYQCRPFCPCSTVSTKM
jgi:hypothetical protein